MKLISLGIWLFAVFSAVESSRTKLKLISDMASAQNIVTPTGNPPPATIPTALPSTPPPTPAATPPPTTAATPAPTALPATPPPTTLPSLTPAPTPPPTTTAPAATTARPPLPSLPPITGPGGTPFPLIDPRLGTAAPSKLRDAETLRDSELDTDASEGAVTFPRNKRSVIEHKNNYVKRTKRQANCGCFTPTQCSGTPAPTTLPTLPPTPPPNTNGAGLIDFRIVIGGGQTTVPPAPACSAGLVFCCVAPTAQISCGSRIIPGVTYPTVSGQAKYGEYPWMVVILTNDNQYVGGGTLIDLNHVLTAAHRIASYPNGVGLKIRLGEWDAAGNYEQYPYRDYSIARVWTHESFNPNTLQNTIALIRLTGGVPVGTPGVIPICMPTAAQSFDGQRCWVSGWGKDAFGVVGNYQTILKATDVPVIPQAACETTLRTTRLGTAFILDRTAFICAGGEPNKDACTGDGGSGMVCEVTPGRWVLAGLVAWGLGCAAQGVPAAYVNVVNYLPWITPKLVM